MFLTAVPCALLLLATGDVLAYSVTTSTPIISVPENKSMDLKCAFTADFGTPRVEWKFKHLHSHSQGFIVFDGKPIASYQNRVDVYNGGMTFKAVTRADTGEYSCEVSGGGGYGEVTINVTVQVPSAPPFCGIPSSVTTGTHTVLTCFDRHGSPPSTYKWYKNKTPLPEDPSQFPAYQNSTFRINSRTGTMDFKKVSKADTGDYYCTASNGLGSPQSCPVVRMEVNDLNTGGIVAGVFIALLAVALLCFGLWYAHRKGYLPKKNKSSNGTYSSPPNYADDADGEFKQKSSFIV